MAPRTKRELSLDAQKARMEAWAVKLSLPKEKVDDLLDRYGPYAYALMQKAMLRPNDLGAKTSRGAVEDLVGKQLSSEKIAEMFGEKNALTVDNKIAQARIEAARREAAEIEAKGQNKDVAQVVENRQDKLEKKVNDEKPAKEQTQEKQTPPAQQTQQQSPAQEIIPDTGTPMAPKDENTILTTQWGGANIPEPEKDLTISPDTVTVQPIITKEHGWNVLKSTAFVGGKPITELKDSTQQSIFGVTHTREVGSQKNPIGVVGSYWGAMQHSITGAQKIAEYALLHDGEYGNIADKFFNKGKPGFIKAMTEFKAAVEKDPKAAWADASKERRALAGYLKSNYRQLFSTEGIVNPVQFLQLQRDAASTVTASYYKLDKVVNVLKSQGIDPLQVNPAVWGMVVSVGIARGNIGSIENLFKGKSLSYINSKAMVDKIAETYQTVFHTHAPKGRYEGEKAAVQFAKDHVGEKHSVTTVRELSLMLNNPTMYSQYLQQVAQNQTESKEQGAVQVAKGNNNPVLTPYLYRQVDVRDS